MHADCKLMDVKASDMQYTYERFDGHTDTWTDPNCVDFFLKNVIIFFLKQYPVIRLDTG